MVCDVVGGMACPAILPYINLILCISDLILNTAVAWHDWLHKIYVFLSLGVGLIVCKLCLSLVLMLIVTTCHDWLNYRFYIVYYLSNQFHHLSIRVLY